MNKLPLPWFSVALQGLLALGLGALSASAAAQNAIEDLPGYERYRQLSREAGSIGTEGRIHDVRWLEGGSAVLYRKARNGPEWRVDLPVGEIAKADGDEHVVATDHGGPARRRPARGRQRDTEPSPDGQWITKCTDWNVTVESSDGERTIVVTTEGHRKHRFGKASWVYGEELRQHDAMWWSPDSTKLAYYEFDERAVPDYHLIGGLTELRTELLIEGYPKAGDPNPIAKLWIYDLEMHRSIPVDVGEASGDQYVYNVRFTPCGSELLFSRTNRRQNVLEIVAADVETGASRIVLTETQETWQHNRPLMRFLADGERFIWESERTGWRQYELRSMDGSLINVLTEGEYPVATIVHVHEVPNVESPGRGDEENETLGTRSSAVGTFFYTAYSDPDNPLNQHLYRVDLDGSNHRRLTSETANHAVELSPCVRWFIARYESAESPPVTAIYDVEGNELGTLAEGSWERFEELELTPPELFTFKADDGETDLYGVLFKPSQFNPDKKYPLLIDVYGGPWIQRVRNTWRAANPACEFGFIIAQIDNRGTPNRGKAFEDAAYMKLGDVDLRDQVAAVKYLRQRDYIDGDRVGIYGSSYGGYMAALAMLRFPDVFHAGVAMAAVTDWRNYDTIYTERFMRLPDENPEGYERASCMTYVENLEGALLIMHGMLDDNVHPANAWQLIHALDEAGKRYEMRLFPTRGHGLGPLARSLQWEFLHRHLIGERN